MSVCTYKLIISELLYRMKQIEIDLGNRKSDEEEEEEVRCLFGHGGGPKEMSARNSLCRDFIIAYTFCKSLCCICYPINTKAHGELNWSRDIICSNDLVHLSFCQFLFFFVFFKPFIGFQSC